MKTIRIFHVLSHARWVFFVWSVYLMIQVFRDPNRYALANTGLAVFLMGLFLGFLGFSDIQRLSRRERKSNGIFHCLIKLIYPNIVEIGLSARTTVVIKTYSHFINKPYFGEVVIHHLLVIT